MNAIPHTQEFEPSSEMMTATPTMKNQQHAYSRELLVMAVTGLFSGLVSSGLSLIAGGSHAELAVLSFGAMMGLSASLLERKGALSNLKLVLGVMAGGVMLLFLGTNVLLSAVIGGLLLGTAMTFDREDFGWPQRLALIAAHGLALAAGMYTSGTLMGVGFLSDFARIPVLSSVIQAALWTLFLMLPAGLKYMQWRENELSSEIKAASQGLDAKHRHTLDVAQETYERILDEIEREGSEAIRERASAIAQEVIQGLIALTRRSDELHRAIQRTNARPLEIRARELEDRIRATRDVALRRELVAALSEVVEQMRTRRRLETACARIEARQQRYLTALDKLHVTLVQNDSLSSSEGALVHSLDELSQLTEQVRWQNLSVDELLDGAPGDEMTHEQEAEQAESALVEDSELDDLLEQMHSLSGYTSPPPTQKRQNVRRVVLDVAVSAADGHVGGVEEAGAQGGQEARVMFSSGQDEQEEDSQQEESIHVQQSVTSSHPG